jgi:DNA-binding LacI/PurR family transcriptional regulator
MAEKPPTVRSLAASLGLSRATVSNALRGHPGVARTTRARVQKMAEKMGYTRNLLAARVMSQLRKRGDQKLLGTIGVLDLHEPDRPPQAGSFHDALRAGIRKRSVENGFAVSFWSIGPHGDVTCSRLNRILKWRGISGVVLLPAWHDPDFSGLDWTGLTGVYLDYAIHLPPLHTVCTDHYRTVHSAMEKARERGYRRPGFVIQQNANERIHGRYLAAYLGYLHNHPEMEGLDPLVTSEITPERFTGWFRKERPDVVLTHWLKGYETLTSLGVNIPGDCGFLCLNLHAAPPNVSGFQLQPERIAECGTDLLLSHLLLNERGPPLQPTIAMVPSVWSEGATVRRRQVSNGPSAAD